MITLVRMRQSRSFNEWYMNDFNEWFKIILSRTFVNIDITSKKFYHCLKLQFLKMAEIQNNYLEDLFIELV